VTKLPQDNDSGDKKPGPKPDTKTETATAEPPTNQKRRGTWTETSRRAMRLRLGVRACLLEPGNQAKGGDAWWVARRPAGPGPVHTPWMRMSSPRVAAD
jgi:hypothetical protein